MKTLKSKILNTAMRYGKDERGNFAVMFAVTVFALVGGLACSIDMTNAFKTKSRLQDVTDAIVLQAAKDKSLDTQAKLQKVAQDYLALHYPNNSGDRIVINSIARDGDTVTIDATDNVDTYFAQIFGFENLDVSVDSTATYAQRNVDIALVLDTTESMAGSKLSSLKTAATNLVTTLEKEKNSNLNISVVPFGNYVNVGKSRRNAIWLDVEDDGTKEVCWNKHIPGTGTCTPYQSTCTNDAGTYACTKWKCTGRKYENYCEMRNTVWNGCVGSRISPWHERVAYSGHKIPGLLDIKCGTEIQTLTNNMSSVKSTINSLSAKGYTYIPSGLSWGWRTLDTNEPLTEAKIDPRKETDKALILMTDGKNTRSKSGEWHETRNGVDANKVTKNLCQDIKDSEIMVYTIAYELDDAPTKNMLQKCANDSSMYFDAKNSDQLNKAFQEIADSLNELRLTN